jgi:hypothetical protein
MLLHRAAAAAAAGSPLAIKAHKACYLKQRVVVLLLNPAAPVPGRRQAPVNAGASVEKVLHRSSRHSQQNTGRQHLKDAAARTAWFNVFVFVFAFGSMILFLFLFLTLSKQSYYWMPCSLHSINQCSTSHTADPPRPAVQNATLRC